MTELLKEIEKKIKFLLILKAKPLPPGTVRVWGEERYRKGTDGKWRKIGRCIQSDLKNIANKKLTRENIEGLKVVSSRQFNEIVDLLFEGRYKDLPNIIRLPNIDKNLAEKLGLQRRRVYLFKDALTHIRPGRKARYGQALREEEYKMIPNVIREAKEVFIDRVKHNFQIVFSDQKDINKINKIIFNKDKEGNYLVTIGKVDRGSEVKNIKKSVVRDGSCTRNTCSPEGDHPNTRLSASLTTTTNISQNQEKSSPVVKKMKRRREKWIC